MKCKDLKLSLLIAQVCAQSKYTVDEFVLDKIEFFFVRKSFISV